MLSARSGLPAGRGPYFLLRLACCAALAVLVGGWLVGELLVSSPRASRVVSDVVLTAACWGSGFTCAVTARRQSSQVAWSFAGFCLLSALGQMFVTVADLLDHSPPWASRLDVVFVGATALALYGATTAHTWPSGLGQVRVVLDGLFIAMALLFTAWAFVLRDVANQATSLLEGLGYVAFPLLDIAVIVMLVLALPRISPAARSSGYLALVAMTGIGFSDARVAHLSGASRVPTGRPVDLGWVVGFALIGLAAAWRSPLTRTRQVPRAAESDQVRLLLLLAPYPFVLSAVVTALWTIIAGPGLDNGLSAIGVVEVVILVARQVATLMESEQRAQALVRQAIRDPLTGLFNRTHFRHRLDRALQHRSGPSIVFFIDVDDFKDLNDSFGHSVGDDVLCRLSLRLRDSLKTEDMVARLGGDEFGVVLDRITHAHRALDIASRVTGSLSAPMMVQREQRSLTVSVGVAVGYPGGDTAEVLLRNADLAMYEAKRRGRNRCVLYEPQMHATVLARTELVQQLETAVERGEFRVYYQPTLDLESGELVGAEALLRWEHPERGLLPPGAFLAAAEQSGLIVEIGAWLLDRGCRFVSGLISEQLVSSTFQLSVNVSPRGLRDPALVAQFAQSLAKGPMQAHQLVAEITESVFVETEESLLTLRELRSLGVRIAVDDFGTGYSSLSYLDCLPVDVLKIDQSFIVDVDRNDNRRAIVKAVIDMAATLSLTTVAEGIERQSQLTALTVMGCQRGQGFLLSKPLDEGGFVDYLVRGRATSRQGFEPTRTTQTPIRRPADRRPPGRVPDDERDV